MKIKFFIISLSALLIAFSCTKKETDTTPPFITISSPAVGEMFTSGDSVLVAFSVTDADLHGYDYAIIKTATDDTIFDNDLHSHASITFNQKFKLSDAATQFKLIVNGEDHSGNTSSKSVNFHTM